MEVLFTTIEEIQEHCTAISNALHFDTLKPSLRNAQKRVARELMGNALLDSLEAAYTDSIADPPTALSSDMAKLLEAVRAVVANWAVVEYIAVNQSEVTEKGNVELSGEDAVAAKLWKVTMQKDGITEVAESAAMDLQELLETDYLNNADWTSSKTYSLLKSNLMQSARVFDEYIFINSSRLLFRSLKPTIRRVEEKVCDEYLGTAFYTNLVDAVNAGNATAEQLTAISKLLAAIAHYTIGYSNMPIQMGSNGIYTQVSESDKGGKSQKLPTAAELHALRHKMLAEGEELMVTAQKYLNSIASVTIFPDYFASSYYSDPTVEIQRHIDNSLFTSIVAF